ncbi:MAG TPA: response regulator transcription factor [Pyrinomonadaceae bacterium]|nr:response regulator transcription factor [Pyrinomonadaceae bacterium]
METDPLMQTNNSIKIFLLGNYSIFRSALKMLIESKQGLEVIGEAATIAEATAAFERRKPDVILVDLPDGADSSLLPAQSGLGDLTPILVLSATHDAELYQRCLKLNIKGMVRKQKGADVLFKAIEKVHAGEYWLERSIMGNAIRSLIEERNTLNENSRNNQPQQLTDRERQVVTLICTGLKNKDIAEKLCITETTVRHHLTSIFEKLGTKNRLELVLHAFRNNWEKVPIKTETLLGDIEIAAA